MIEIYTGFVPSNINRDQSVHLVHHSGEQNIKSYKTIIINI